MNRAHLRRINAHLREFIAQGYRSLSDAPKPRQKAPEGRNYNAGQASTHQPEMNRAMFDELVNYQPPKRRRSY